MAKKDSDPKVLAKKFGPELEAELTELTQQSFETADDRAPVALDQQNMGRLSRMDAMQGQAMAQERERRRRQRMEQIRAALKRIEEGEYGYCTSCGEPIAVRRLEIDPATPECISCASG